VCPTSTFIHISITTSKLASLREGLQSDTQTNGTKKFDLYHIKRQGITLHATIIALITF